jgi:hypothetical protein
MLEHGAFVALSLLAVWVALLIPLARGTLKAIPFGAASMFLALMVPFFWLRGDTARGVIRWVLRVMVRLMSDRELRPRVGARSRRSSLPSGAAQRAVNNPTAVASN